VSVRHPQPEDVRTVGIRDSERMRPPLMARGRISPSLSSRRLNCGFPNLQYKEKLAGFAQCDQIDRRFQREICVSLSDRLRYAYICLRSR
jgi:hypothetical protein